MMTDIEEKVVYKPTNEKWWLDFQGIYIYIYIYPVYYCICISIHIYVYIHTKYTMYINT